MTPACAGLLEHRGSGLELLKFSFSAENFIAVCLGLSPAISAQVTLKLCLIAQNCKKKSLKTLILKVQGRTRLSMLIPLKSVHVLVLVMISNMSVSIWNHFYARQAKSGNIRTS